MADEPTVPEEEQPPAEEPAAVEQPPTAEPTAEPTAVEEPVAEEPLGQESAAAEESVEIVAEEVAPGDLLVEESIVEDRQAAAGPAAAPEPAAAAEPAAAGVEAEELEEEEEEPAPRVKPAVPGAHLEVDIVPEGVDPLAREPADPYATAEYEEELAAEEQAEEEQVQLPQPISTAAIDLAAGARYRATGKRKTAIARVILRPGSGAYLINGRPLEEYFPRATLQRNIRQPLETVGYEEKMDVVALLQGGGISSQAGALRHGVSRALLEADPNLRGELKRRGFLTRDSRAKERKKAGLKKARKRPQFSKR
jgi:small subunit ribosomal protein S9